MTDIFDKGAMLEQINKTKNIELIKANQSQTIVVYSLKYKQNHFYKDFKIQGVLNRKKGEIEFKSSYDNGSYQSKKAGKVEKHLDSQSKDDPFLKEFVESFMERLEWLENQLYVFLQQKMRKNQHIRLQLVTEEMTFSVFNKKIM